MSLMSKLLTTSLLASLSISAQNIDIKKFINKNILHGNPKVKILDIKTIQIADINNSKNWKAHMNLVSMEYKGKKINEPMIIFVNEAESLATTSLIDTNTNLDLATTIRPQLTESYYNKEHLISGEINAKHKIVIFSDPQCPFCIKFVPSAIEKVKANKDIALFYYHMPLEQLHPISGQLVYVMEALQKQGRIDDAFKIYQLKASYSKKGKNISIGETDPQKVLDAVKNQLGIELKLSDITNKEIVDAVQDDKIKGASMMIRGTPTVYIDGKYDDGRKMFDRLVK